MKNDDNTTERRPTSPPRRPKRKTGSTPPPRPKRQSERPAPLPAHRGGSPFAGGSKRIVIMAAVGLLCVVALAAGLGALFGLGGPSSTTAEQYTSNEVREIIRLLREDLECRDTRLGNYFEQNSNSLELWERVLGKPAAVVGRETSPDWTYTTSDGALTVHVGVDYGSGEIPFVTAYGSGHLVGGNSNKPVDSDALKQTIISIKSRIDPGDSVAFETEVEDRWKQEQIAEDDRRLQKRIDDARKWAFSDAESEFRQLRLALPKGVGRDPFNAQRAFDAQKDDWIKRRGEAVGPIHVAEIKQGAEFTSDVPLPSADAVLNALRAGKQAPVVPVEGAAVETSAVETSAVETTPSPSPPSIGEPAALVQPAPKTSPVPAPPKSESETTPANAKSNAPNPKSSSDTKTREQKIAELTEDALNKQVSLTKPYPELYEGAPRDKISVQYAVLAIARQAGFQYDFEQSLKNTDPICRRWVRPQIRDAKCRDALESILRPAGLTYQTANGAIVLERRD